MAELQSVRRRPAPVPLFVLQSENTYVTCTRFVRLPVCLLPSGHVTTASPFDTLPALITGDSNGTVVMWNLTDRHPFCRWSAHIAPVLHVESALEGRIAITQGKDGTIRVWDMTKIIRISDALEMNQHKQHLKQQLHHTQQVSSVVTPTLIPRTFSSLSRSIDGVIQEVPSAPSPSNPSSILSSPTSWTNSQSLVPHPLVTPLPIISPVLARQAPLVPFKLVGTTCCLATLTTNSFTFCRFSLVEDVLASIHLTSAAHDNALKDSNNSSLTSHHYLAHRVLVLCTPSESAPVLKVWRLTLTFPAIMPRSSSVSSPESSSSSSTSPTDVHSRASNLIVRTIISGPNTVYAQASSHAPVSPYAFQHPLPTPARVLTASSSSSPSTSSRSKVPSADLVPIKLCTRLVSVINLDDPSSQHLDRIRRQAVERQRMLDTSSAPPIIEPPPPPRVLGMAMSVSLVLLHSLTNPFASISHPPCTATRFTSDPTLSSPQLHFSLASSPHIPSSDPNDGHAISPNHRPLHKPTITNSSSKLAHALARHANEHASKLSDSSLDYDSGESKDSVEVKTDRDKEQHTATTHVHLDSTDKKDGDNEGHEEKALHEIATCASHALQQMNRASSNMSHHGTVSPTPEYQDSRDSFKGLVQPNGCFPTLIGLVAVVGTESGHLAYLSIPYEDTSFIVQTRRAQGLCGCSESCCSLADSSTSSPFHLLLPPIATQLHAHAPTPMAQPSMTDPVAAAMPFTADVPDPPFLLPKSADPQALWSPYTTSRPRLLWLDQLSKEPLLSLSLGPAGFDPSIPLLAPSAKHDMSRLVEGGNGQTWGWPSDVTSFVAALYHATKTHLTPGDVTTHESSVESEDEAVTNFLQRLHQPPERSSNSDGNVPSHSSTQVKSCSTSLLRSPQVPLPTVTLMGHAGSPGAGFFAFSATFPVLWSILMAPNCQPQLPLDASSDTPLPATVTGTLLPGTTLVTKRLQFQRRNIEDYSRIEGPNRLAIKDENIGRDETLATSRQGTVGIGDVDDNVDSHTDPHFTKRIQEAVEVARALDTAGLDGTASGLGGLNEEDLLRIAKQGLEQKKRGRGTAMARDQEKRRNYLVNPEEEGTIHDFEHVSRGVADIATRSDGKYVAVAGWDRRVRMFRVSWAALSLKGDRVTPLSSDDVELEPHEIVEDGRQEEIERKAVGGPKQAGDTAQSNLPPANSKQVALLRHHRAGLTAIDFCPDPLHLYPALSAMEPLDCNATSSHTSLVSSSMSLSTSSRDHDTSSLLATASKDATVAVWNIC